MLGRHITESEGFSRTAAHLRLGSGSETSSLSMSQQQRLAMQ